MKSMQYLNIGCGNRYHKDWVNLDFVSNSSDVLAHNLLQGIPFDDNIFEVVYHSHVLEHFNKIDGQKLIEECYRVLKPNGIIRIAIPDLELIVGEYSKNLKLALEGNSEAMHNYEWIMIEMYDQTIRNKSGGAMAEYIFREHIPNEDYIFGRIGEEGRHLRNNYLKSQTENKNIAISISKNIKKKSFLRKIKTEVKNYLFKQEIALYKNEKKLSELGKFRLGGEIHQWMYDRYSLGKLLESAGFTKIEVKSCYESNILEWNNFELESKNNIIYKPDSLFIEAKKVASH